MKDFVLKIKAIINKDVKNENETKRYAVVLRILAILMCVYFLISTVMFGLSGSGAHTSFCILFLIIYAVVLFTSYEGDTRLALFITNGATIAWVMLSVLTMGWNTGVQQFLIVSIILYIFSGGEKKRLKITYTLILFTIRMILYYYCFYHEPLLPLGSPHSLRTFHFINTTFIFLELFIVAFSFSITSKELEEKLILYNIKLKKLASTDGLTGLMNRRSLIEYLLEKECKEKREQKISAIAIGDIDHFKKINDTYGHECGDLVLKQLSALMEKFMEGKGLIARWGGEEFLIIFEGYNGDEAFTELFELQNQVREMQIHYKDQTLKISMTFGLEEYTYHGHGEVIDKADNKLYIGKNNGRDQIVY